MRLYIFMKIYVFLIPYSRRKSWNKVGVKNEIDLHVAVQVESWSRSLVRGTAKANVNICIKKCHYISRAKSNLRCLVSTLVVAMNITAFSIHESGNLSHICPLVSMNMKRNK